MKQKNPIFSLSTAGLTLAATLLFLTMGTHHAFATGCTNCGQPPPPCTDCGITVQGGLDDDMFNQFDPLPSGTTPSNPTGAQPNNFEIVFQGNVAGEIPTQPLSNFTDAFSNPNPITVTYQSATNTTVVDFSGNSGFTYPFGNTYDPHFGLDAGYQLAVPLQVVNEYWSLNNTDIGNLPGATISSLNQLATGIADPWAIVYLNETLPGQTTSSGIWEEIPFTNALSISIANDTSQAITLSDAQYFISSTQIALSSLNFNDYPPNTAPFIDIGSIANGTVLAPGQSIDFAATPEPPALWLFGTGLLALGWTLRRRLSA